MAIRHAARMRRRSSKIIMPNKTRPSTKAARPIRISTNCWRGRTSTPWSSPRRIIGMPSSPSPRPRPARTSTAKSRCASRFTRLGPWSTPSAKTSASFKPAPCSGRPRSSGRPASWCATAGSAGSGRSRSPWAGRPGLDWDRWLGPAPRRGYHSELSPRGVHKHFPNWRNYREYGGGMVTDWGAHHFDIAQWALGMDESGPVAIFPADKPEAKHGVRFTYANGVEVIHKDGNGIWFHGVEGRIFVNRGKFEHWRGDQQNAQSPADCDDIAKKYLDESSIRLYKSDNHGSDFLASIKSRKPPICDVEVGARTVTVCHLVNLAYYHGQKMKWDPKAEQFVDGAGDNQGLDVPQRDPWKVV